MKRLYQIYNSEGDNFALYESNKEPKEVLTLMEMAESIAEELILINLKYK